MRNFKNIGNFKEFMSKDYKENNLKNEAKVELIWDYKDFQRELSQKEEKRARKLNELIFKDVRRYCKNRIAFIDRTMKYYKNLRRKTMQLPANEQRKINKLVENNVNELMTFQKRILQSNTLNELASVKKPMLIQIKLD